jgi:hypothetical protein
MLLPSFSDLPLKMKDLQNPKYLRVAFVFSDISGFSVINEREA